LVETVWFIKRWNIFCTITGKFTVAFRDNITLKVMRS